MKETGNIINIIRNKLFLSLKLKNDKGAIAIIAAISLIAMIGMMAFVVDVGQSLCRKGKITDCNGCCIPCRCPRFT